MEFISTTKAAFLLHLSPQRLRQLLAADRIEGAFKEGLVWRIPLFNGMPKVIEGTRGPQGTWRKRQQQVPSFFHVNQQQIRKNKGETCEPVISVHQGSKTTLCHGVEIPGVGRLVYEPNNPKSCGAKVWLELNPDVFFKMYCFA